MRHRGEDGAGRHGARRDPVASQFDGDVVFALASGTAPRVEPFVVGVVGAALTAEAIRDACRRATSLHGIPPSDSPQV